LISFYERQAIWEAHGRRCAYCGERLTFAKLEIDHIMARSTTQVAAEWLATLTAQGLQADFDVDAPENLAPSCGPCNRKKLDRPLLPGRIGIELARAAALAPRVRALAAKYRAAESETRLKLEIAAALEFGALSAVEISRLAKDVRAGTRQFPIRSVFSLFGDRSVRDVSPQDYEAYLDTPVPLPPEMAKGLRLVSNDGSERLVRTLREFDAAIEAGYHAYSTFEMDVAYQAFIHPVLLLRRLRNASIADTSFIDEPIVGLPDIALLPAGLLFLTDDMTNDPAFAGRREKLKGKSIQDLVSAGDAVLASVASDRIAVEYDHGHTFMMEIMRADLNGDGVQDLLIHWAAGPIGGTYSTATQRVLSRHSPDGMLELVRDDEGEEE